MGFRLLPSSVSEYSTLGGNLGVDLAMNKTAFLHGAKLCGQHFLRHRTDGFFQLAEYVWFRA